MLEGFISIIQAWSAFSTKLIRKFDFTTSSTINNLFYKNSIPLESLKFSLEIPTNIQGHRWKCYLNNRCLSAGKPFLSCLFSDAFKLFQLTEICFLLRLIFLISFEFLGKFAAKGFEGSEFWKQSSEDYQRMARWMFTQENEITFMR